MKGFEQPALRVSSTYREPASGIWPGARPPFRPISSNPLFTSGWRPGESFLAIIDCGGNRSTLSTPDCVLEVVLFALLLDLLNHRMRRIERMLGPIMLVGLTR